MSKLFGLGFHKTGSTTLESALITLGYDCVGKHDHLFDAIDQKDWVTIDKAVGQHDAFRDMPWPLFYKELDNQYPGSKFVLTVRNPEGWIKSCNNHYKETGRKEFAKIYGQEFHYPLGNEQHWISTYESHNQAVRNYFSGRSKDFLEVNWETGDGWEKICAFLNQPIPDRSFPHANKGQYSLFGKAKRKIWWLVDKRGFKRRNRDL